MKQVLRAPLLALCLALASPGASMPDTARAAGAAIHPVSSQREMLSWLGRVPRTASFPPDLEPVLRGQGPAFLIEMSTAPGCLPCGDLWSRFSRIGGRYGLAVRTIDRREAMMRSSRLGLPWVGHPVAWVRPVADPNRIIPVAIGTDHEANLVRNLYLAIKMQTGVRTAVGVRAMAKFTGIVGATNPSRVGR